MYLHRRVPFFLFFLGLLTGVLLLTGKPASASPYPTVVKEDLNEERVYSPYAGRAYADQVFFGDTHFHTNLSFDAGLVGTSLDVHDGFRMARGEKVMSNFIVS